MSKFHNAIFLFFIFVLFFYSRTVFPETVDGRVVLEDKSDHSGIEIKFDDVYSPATYTTTTNSLGEFSQDVEGGTYDITYSKTGYYTLFFDNIQVLGPVPMPDTTLYIIRSLIEVPQFLPAIQTAIDWAQDGDTILIDNGTYYENLVCDTKRLLFASNYLFTKDTNDILNTVIDGNYQGIVLRLNNVKDTTCGVTGLTIRRGFDEGYDDGAGIYCDYSDITLDHLIIEKDSGTFGYGGHGVYCYESYVIIINTLIRNNHSGYDGGGIYGFYSDVKLSDSKITHNIGYYGGGIYVYYGNAFINNVIISNNSAREGGGIWSSTYCNIYINSSEISGNHGTSFWGTGGGGVYINGDMQVSNTLICNNTSTAQGGGLYINECSPVFNKVVIDGNEAEENGGGIYITDPGHACGPVIKNSVISNNLGNGGIYNDPTDYGAFDIKYNDIWNNENSNFFNCGIAGIKNKKNANGDSCDYYFNIDLDPLFVGPSNGDYHLQQSSPCIDAGDPASPADPDGTIPDIGAFSIFQTLTQPIPDFNCSDSISCSLPFNISFTDLSTPNVLGGNIVEWFWSFGDGNTSADRNPAHEYHDAGKYTVSLTVKNEGGQDSTKTITDFIRVSGLQVNISDSTHISCYGLSDGTATVLASGGITPYSYNWDDPATTEDPQVTGLSPNQYYHITVTDAIGCIANDSVILTEPEIITSFMSDIINPTCYDYYMGSATVNVSGGNPPYAYLWDDPSNTTTAVVSGLHAYKYYHVTISDDSGCEHSDSIMLSQLDDITSNIDIISGISCYGLDEGSASLSFSGGTAPYEILWDDPGGSTTTLASGLSGDQYYHVSIEDFNGCIIYDSIMIPQPSLLESSITDITGISHAGASDGSATVTPVGGTIPYSYLWDDDLNTTDSTVSELEAEKYYHVLVTDANGCTTFDSVCLPAFVPLTAEITSYSDVSCYGMNDGNATVTILSGNPPYTIQWNDNEFTQNETVTDLEADKWYVVTVNDAGTQTVSDSVWITQPSILVLSTENVQNISCNGADNGAILISVTGGTPSYSYTWAGPDSYASTDEDITNLEPGDYNVDVTDGNGCATASGTITITEPDVLTTTLNLLSHITCFGEDNGSISVTVTGGTFPYTYAWTGPSGFTSSSEDISALGPGNYNLLVTDNNDCNAGLNTVTINEPPATNITTNLVTNVLCFGGKNGTISVTTSGGTLPYTFNWTGPGIYSSSTEDITNLGAGDYNLTLTDGNSCIVTHGPIVITQPDPFDISKTYSPIICPGSENGFITINVSGGVSPYLYSWSDGSYTQNLTNLPAGTYKVTVTDWNDCQIIDSTKIDNFATPPVPEICLVTVNRENSIVVVWEKIYNQGIASYNIYREQSKNNYQKIGSVPFDSLSIFIDHSSIPDEISHFYKITLVDSCGNESAKSPYHKSIHLQTSMGLSAEINLFWDEYEGFDYYEYIIYRGTSLDELFNIRTITSSAKSWTDKSPPKGQVYYRVEVVRPSSCFPTRFKAEEYGSTFSNYDEETVAGIDDLNNNNLLIYPNPFSDQTTISFPNPSFYPYKLIISDLSGRIVKILGKITADEIVLSGDDLPEGVYLLELKGIEIYRGKIVVE